MQNKDLAAKIMQIRLDCLSLADGDIDLAADYAHFCMTGEVPVTEITCEASILSIVPKD